MTYKIATTQSPDGQWRATVTSGPRAGLSVVRTGRYRAVDALAQSLAGCVPFGVAESRGGFRVTPRQPTFTGPMFRRGELGEEVQP